MDAYDEAAASAARSVISAFSTSFGMASRLFDKYIRQDIYNIYGLVRLADEIVDSYRGEDAEKLLIELEAETYAAIKRGFSTNLVVHAFALSACKYHIEKAIVQPFFDSMKVDLVPERYKTSQYQAYIYGSAEVVGLMCLRVFCKGDAELYAHLKPGACSLGSAFQKVNFLRDMAADHKELGRYYFPVGSFRSFDESTKAEIIDDIRKDFTLALPAILQLPNEARPAVMAAYRYYHALLNKLVATPAATLKKRRVRVSDGQKLRLLATTLMREKVRTHTV